jgi:hypothetical protein
VANYIETNSGNIGGWDIYYWGLSDPSGEIYLMPGDGIYIGQGSS